MECCLTLRNVLHRPPGQDSTKAQRLESLATSTGFVIWLELARTTVSPATQRAPASSHSLLHLGPSYTLETNADKFFKSFLEEHLLCLGKPLSLKMMDHMIWTTGSKIILEFNFP